MVHPSKLCLSILADMLPWSNDTATKMLRTDIASSPSSKSLGDMDCVSGWLMSSLTSLILCDFRCLLGRLVLDPEVRCAIMTSGGSCASEARSSLQIFFAEAREMGFVSLSDQLFVLFLVAVHV